MKNSEGALYFVLFFATLLLGLSIFLPQLSLFWALIELGIYVAFGAAGVVFLVLIYFNCPDSAGWMLQLLALNLINLAFLFTLLPFSWWYTALFAYSFLGLVLGIPFQANAAKKKRVVRIFQRRNKTKSTIKSRR